MFSKNLKKLSALATVFIMAASLTACNVQKNADSSVKEDTKKAEENASRTIKDMKGNEVVVPVETKKIADLWHANNQVVMLLGGEGKLVATTNVIQSNPWINEIFPNIKNISAPVQGKELNIEELIKTEPEVVITFNEKQYNEVKSAGLNPVYVFFQDFAGLKKCVSVTAEAMGGNSPKIAEEFNRELDENISFVKDRLKDIKEDEKPRVLHIVGAKDLTKIDGQKSIVGEWMDIAGAVNAIPDAENMENITTEQLIKSNPDIIIVGGAKAQAALDKIKNDPAWKDVNAVKNDRLMVNPVGTFNWDRYSCEEALQVLWAAKTFHGDKFEDVDMVKKTQEFYKKYYNYDLSKENAENILNGKDPAK